MTKQFLLGLLIMSLSMTSFACSRTSQTSSTPSISSTPATRTLPTKTIDQLIVRLTPTFSISPMAYPYPESNQHGLLTSTPTNFFSQRNRTSLNQAALTSDDIPYSSDTLYSYFIDPQITPTDNSTELIDLCGIDCVKKIWTDTNQRRGFVIVMYQVSDPNQAKYKVEESLTHQLKIFDSNLIIGKTKLPGLPQHSWITASNRVKGLVGDFITLQTSWGPIVVILSEQGDIKPREIPLDDYFLTIQRLAVLQLDKLKSAGYNEQ